MNSKEKQKITEEMGLHRTWLEKAEQQTVDTFEAFVRHLIDDYDHDYGTIVHACAAAGIAAVSAINKSSAGSITGFQASRLMWVFVEHFGMFTKGSPLTIREYSDLCYPQYDYKWRTVSLETWEWVQNYAYKLLNENDSEAVDKDVWQRWKNIRNGIIPCGLKLENEREEELTDGQTPVKERGE